MKQVFVAPDGEEDLALHDESPWFFSRGAILYFEYWELILEEVEKWKPGGGEILRNLTIYEDRDDGEFIAIAKYDEIIEGIECLTDFSKHICGTRSLVVKESEAIPDVFDNFEIKRMIDAVVCVLRESLRIKVPYRVWVD